MNLRKVLSGAYLTSVLSLVPISLAEETKEEDRYFSCEQGINLFYQAQRIALGGESRFSSLSARVFLRSIGIDSSKLRDDQNYFWIECERDKLKLFVTNPADLSTYLGNLELEKLKDYVAAKSKRTFFAGL